MADQDVPTRTHQVFQGTTPLNTVALGLTTHCTMRCPKCTLGMVRDKADGTAAHARVTDLIKAGQIMRPMRRVHLTGGEPTMHPDFELIAKRVREWFRADYVTIETNGSGYKQHRDTFKECFDVVFITHYVRDLIYPDNFDNTHVILMAREDLGDKLIQEPPVLHELSHQERKWDGPGRPCTKWFLPGLASGYYDGKLYSCCVSYGIDKNLGLPLDKHWDQTIKTQDMGCDRCVFRGT